MFIKHPLFFIILCIATHNNARDEDTMHVWEGNLALPISQQPTPLFAFGQNIVAKGDLQLFGQADYLPSNHNTFIEVIPGILFGVTKNLSLFFNIPAAARSGHNQNRSFGIEDVWLQAEYAFFNRDEERYAIQSTLVGIVFFPTEASKQNPSTGINAPAVLIGTTLSYTGVDWYAYISPEGVFSLDSQNKKIFLYQAGFGRNIAYSSKNRVLTPLIELYGAFSKNSASNNTPERQNSFPSGRAGGNNLYLGPTIWFATQRFILQAGILIPVLQKVTAENPNKNKYWAAANIGWKFN